MNKKALFVVAHPDDEILGCGGTLAYLRECGAKTAVLYLSEGVSSRYTNSKGEDLEFQILNREKMAQKASKYLGFKILDFLRYKNLKMDKESVLEITKKILEKLNSFKPDIIFTHHPNDLNLDHKITYEATITACRPVDNLNIKKIFLFETPSSTDWSHKTGNFFKPNHFFNIEKFYKKKIKALNFYRKEMRRHPHPRSVKNINALAIFRGGEVGLKYAEAFEIIRSIDF